MVKIIFISLISFVQISAQQSFDSILKSIENKSDTAQIRSINDYCLKLRGTNPELAVELGIHSLMLAKQVGNKHFEAESNNLIGVLLRNSGKYNNALRYHLDAMKIAKEADDSVQLGFTYNNLGVIYRQQNNLTLAAENIIKGLEIFEKINSLDGLAFSNLTLGTIFVLQKDYTRALTYYRYALNIRELQHNSVEKARILTHIASAYLLMQRYDEAYHSYIDLVSLYTELHDKRGLGEAYVGIGKIYSMQYQNLKALSYFNKALVLFKQLDNKEDIVIASRNLGLLFARLNNPSLGYPYIREALSLADEIKSPMLYTESLKFASQYFEQLGKLDSSLAYLNKYQELRDSLTEEDNFTKLADMEALYQTERQERENRILQQTISAQKQQKYFLFIISVLVFLFAVAFLVRNRALHKINQELRELHAMKDTFFRIIAHDLRAPFNSIFGLTDLLLEDYASLNDEERVKLIENVAFASKQSFELLENLLLWARSNTGKLEFNPQSLNLKGIVAETLRLLQPVAIEKKITMESTIDDKITIYADSEMLKTILRNLISNSVKFCRENEGVIKVTATIEHQKIFIKISDNGVGMNDEKVKNLFRIDKTKTTKGTKGEKGTGLGLLLCKEFIDKHKGEIAVQSKVDAGTTFTLIFDSENPKQ